MAKFEHHKYPEIQLQDPSLASDAYPKGVYAKFIADERTFGEHAVKVGVFETDDATVIERLRASTDPHLKEVDAPKKAPAKKAAAKSDES